MQIIKDDAKLLTEEGELISNIKGIGDDINMEEYTMYLDNIINEKLSIYSKLKTLIENYKINLGKKN